MAKYLRSEVEATAVQYNGDLSSLLSDELYTYYNGCVEVEALYGKARVEVNDWIVREPNGDVGVYSPQTFERLFKPVEQETKVLSCPCCGGEASIRNLFHLYWVRCSKCSLETHECADEELAVFEWNRRTPLNKHNWFNDIKNHPEFGGSRTKRASELITKAIKYYGSPVFLKEMCELGLEYWPELCWMLARIGKEMEENQNACDDH